MSQLPCSLFSHVTQWEIISSTSVSKAPTTFILEFNGIPPHTHVVKLPDPGGGFESWLFLYFSL